MSGGVVSTYANGLAGKGGIGGVSFVHIGAPTGSYYPYATMTKDGIRLNYCKAYSILKALCDFPSQYVDISGGCDFFPEECGL